MSTTNELRRSWLAVASGRRRSTGRGSGGMRAVDIVATAIIAPLVAVGGWVAGDVVITKIEARRVVREAERILVRSRHEPLTGAGGGRRA